MFWSGRFGRSLSLSGSGFLAHRAESHPCQVVGRITDVQRLTHGKFLVVVSCYSALGSTLIFTQKAELLNLLF